MGREDRRPPIRSATTTARYGSSRSEVYGIGALRSADQDAEREFLHLLQLPYLIADKRHYVILSAKVGGVAGVQPDLRRCTRFPVAGPCASAWPRS